MLKSHENKQIKVERFKIYIKNKRFIKNIKHAFLSNRNASNILCQHYETAVVLSIRPV